MPLQKNLNVSPYYADYNPASDYYKVLYKAGYPIQARELTNSQLMLQNQIETFMSRFLKEGDTVVPGEFGYANSSYVRASSITQGATAQDFVGFTLTGVVSGVKAFVNFATAETTTDDVTFYVNYQSSGTTATQKTFIEGETLESDTTERYTAVVGVNTISKPITSSPIGQGSLFSITEGYYYVDGTSVRCDAQTITLDKYGIYPTYSVGFLVTEEFITSAENPALLDNSQGSTNFAAPGADRLKITLTLQKRALDDDFANPNFIMLGKIQSGNFLGKPDQRTKWSWLEDILAKRTFDESGDYIITEFPIERLEYINTDTTNGVFNANVNGTYPSVPGSGSTVRLTAQEADDQYSIKVAPGAAYVQGYEVGFNNPVYLFGAKPRTQNFRQDANVQITSGYHVTIGSLNSVPDLVNINAEIDTVGLETIRTFRNFTDGYVGDATQTDSQGFVEPFNIGNTPPVTYHILTVSTIGAIDATAYTTVYKGTNSCVVTLVPGATTPVRGGTIGGVQIAYVETISPTPTGLITPRYLMPNAPVENPQDNPGTLGYNSTFDLGIVNAEYFTEFFLVDNNSSNFATAWNVGDLVYGEQTGSSGIVEEGSLSSRLVVSNITGEFAPGENVYQNETDKVSQIAKQGEVVRFVFTDFGTSGSSIGLGSETSIKVQAIGAEITLSKGTDFVFDSVTKELVPTQVGREKLQNFPYPAGSFLAQRINYTLQTVPAGVKGYAFQVAGKVQSSVGKSKSFFAPQPSQPVNFTADIAIRNNNDSEIFPIASGSLFSGDAGNNFLTCDDFIGDPAEQLDPGDIITFVDDTGVSINKLVSFATKPVGYGRERDSAVIYFSTTLERSVNGKTVQRIRIKKKGSAEETLIYELPQQTVASLQSDPLATGINYAVMAEFVVQLQGGTNSVVINTNKQNETFINNLSQTTITVASLPSDPSDVQGVLGRQLSVAQGVSANSGRQITYTLDKTLGTNSVLKILVPVYVTNALAKTKTLNSDQILTVDATAAAKQIISLGIADVIRVTSMKMGDAQLEVRDNYLLDDGQRDNVYELSRLILKPGAPAATGVITITYDYFTHSGEGDFFSVDSYTADGGVNYREVPVFRPQKTQFGGSADTANLFLQLRDCIDFRPVVNSAGATPSIIPVITDDRDSTTSTNFLDSAAYDGNAVVPRFPVRGSLFICDLAYYMPRIDSIFLEKDGALSLVQGVPADEPVAPPPLAVGIRLYDIFLPPYTFTIKASNVRKFNYRRFTMADIAGIDAKIARLEDLVTLSILEQSALNMQVRDAVTGLSRFKNGIVVDRFADHQQGAVGQEQYKNSIDPNNSHLRAGHFTQQVELVEDNQTDLQRQGDGYRKSGSIITVDYENLRFMQNPFATRFMNLQPYTVFTFDGNLVLTPSVDTWQDVTRLPDLVVENDFLFNAMVNLTDEMEEAGFGTTWSDWEESGSSTSSSQNIIRGDRSTIDAAVGNLAASGTNVSSVNQSIQNRVDNGRNVAIAVTDTTTSVTQSRTQSQTRINVSTARIDRTSYGDRVTDVQLARTMRTIPIRVEARRLRPNTRYYIFFDDVECSAWFSPDTIQTDFPDGINRYTEGAVGTTQIGFGQNILSDDVGDVNGIFLIPNGRAPVVGSFYTSVPDVQYQTTGATRSFNTGTRKMRITSSPDNAQDLELVEGFADASFVASGVLLDKQETIVATRVPEFGNSTRVLQTQSRTETTTSQEAEYFDPVAQSFLIDENNPEGLFVTELDVFFKTKDQVEGVEAYLVSTDGQVPTEQILPFSKVVKNSDSNLRVICTLGSGQTVATFDAGTIVTGQTSGATGVIKATQSFDSAATNATTNVTNTVYNVILNNYNGEFVEGEVIVPSVTPAETATFTVVTNTFEIESVRLRSLGSGYHAPTITFSAPQLPGGVTATATVSVGPNGATVAGDIIYKVTMVNKGSGYTQVPSVTFSDTVSTTLTSDGAVVGSAAAADVLVSSGLKAVNMGVSTSEDATAATKFRFHAPIYMLGDTNYAFVLKAPTSLNYNVWTSKLGENQLGTETRVSSQPNLGSLFKSQNGGLWTEDQTQDVKFVLYRAQFETAAAAEVRLNNAPLEPMKLPLNPIETNADGIDVSSNLFGSNPKVIRILGYYHGLLAGDLVAISGVDGTPGGIPNTEINTVHTVIDAGLTYFTVKVTTSATNSERDGGLAGYITPNRPYEVLNVLAGAMAFGTSSLIATNRPAESAGVTGYNTLNKYKLGLANNINLMESYYYDGAKVVANEINESKFRGATELRGNKSLETVIRMSTLSNKVSPVIDFDRTNAIVVRNLVDNPLADASAQGTQEAIISLKTRTTELSLPVKSALAFTNNSVSYSVTVKSYNATTGKIRVIGDAVDKLKGATFAKALLNTIGVDVVVTNGILFIPETSPDGSVHAKWISRQFLFENPCDGIEMKLAVCQYDKTSVRAYYRPRDVGFEGDVTQENWTPFNPDQVLNTTTSSGQTISTAYPGLPDDVNNIRVRNSANPNPLDIPLEGWSNLTFSVQDIPAFDSLQVKIVMTSNNPALTPLIDDMQLVCSE